MLYIFQDETTSTVAPARLYKALTIDGDTIIPKVIPGFRTVEIVEGNGGPGTIKKLTFEEGQHIYVTYALHIYNL
uniref:Bet v I/Major latex protein domain-containing protein n=1 Tax=Lotus japonicus TaxID=34305 RepID=I3SFW8_LOTJA|nr:unknown [Lotus japonicus]